MEKTKNQIRMEKVLQKAKVQTETKKVLTLGFARFFGILAVLLAPLFKNLNNNLSIRK